MKWRLAFLLAGLALGGVNAAAQESPVVRLSDWEQAANGTGVRFLPLPALTDVLPSGQTLPDQTQNGAFQFAVDLSDVRWADDCHCFRYYQIVVRSTRTGAVTRHKFKAVPSGTFDDQRADDVTLTITQDGQSDVGSVSLPVGSAPTLQQANALELSTERALESVVLAGESNLVLSLHNNSGMEVVISQLTVAPDRPELWSAPPSVQAASLPVRIGPKKSLQLQVHLAPRTGKAIGVAWPPTDAAEHHAVLTIDATYENAQFQGRPGQTSLRVPIRFQPDLVTLFLSLLLGVLLGTLLLLLTKRVKLWGPWLRATLIALLTGMGAELVGMMLVAGGSKFLLFGYSLDPWQTVPVSVMGAGMGLLGTKSLDKLRGLFKK